MIVMDSSGWIEIFMEGPRSADFRRFREEADAILVPTVVLYEVHKLALREGSREAAVEIAGDLSSYKVIDLDGELALEAAGHSLRHQLPMADAMVYATAQAHGALLVTGDKHFANLPGVEYLPLSET